MRKESANGASFVLTSPLGQGKKVTYTLTAKDGVGGVSLIGTYCSLADASRAVGEHLDARNKQKRMRKNCFSRTGYVANDDGRRAKNCQKNIKNP